MGGKKPRNWAWRFPTQPARRAISLVNNTTINPTTPAPETPGWIASTPICAGRLDPNEYLTFRSIYVLLTDELQVLWQDSSQQWYRQYRQIMDLLGAGGHFLAERRPNGSLDIRRLLP